MDKAQALHGFWSSFGLPAYDESTVPGTAELPYITYEVSTGALDEPVMLSASIWYKSTSWAAISQKSDAIGDYVGYGGVTLPYDGGLLWIKRSAPFAQRMNDPEGSLRRIVLHIDAEYMSEN